MDYTPHGAQPFWPLEKLETYPLFRRFEPAWAYDPEGPDVVADRQLLKFTTIQEMADNADALCRERAGQFPPCQVALFLYQFPDRGYDDCLHAHWALHADKALGPGHCASAIWIEPLAFPADGPEIQKWATWHLTQHPWGGLARHFAERCWLSAKVRWVSEEARELLRAYLEANHDEAAGFMAQPAEPRHPLA